MIFYICECFVTCVIYYYICALCCQLDEKHARGRRDPGEGEHVGLAVGEYERNKHKLRKQEEYRKQLEQVHDLFDLSFLELFSL
jgi:hypothetical protein